MIDYSFKPLCFYPKCSLWPNCIKIYINIIAIRLYYSSSKTRPYDATVLKTAQRLHEKAIHLILYRSLCC